MCTVYLLGKNLREGGDRKDGKKIHVHEKHGKVSRAKCTQLFELFSSHEHCVYLPVYPHHSLHVYICKAGLRLYSVTYLPTIERMTEVERGQGGHLISREVKGITTQ